MRPLRAIAWTGLITIAAGALHVLGSGALAPPPVFAPASVADWAGSREPVVVVMALVRLGAELVAWYLLAVTVLQGLAVGLRRASVDRLADALSLGTSRRLVRAGLGLSLLAVATNAAPAGAGEEPPSTTATMRPVDAGGMDTPAAGPAAEPVPAAGHADSGRASMTPLEPNRSTTPSSTEPTPETTASTSKTSKATSTVPPAPVSPDPELGTAVPDDADVPRPDASHGGHRTADPPAPVVPSPAAQTDAAPRSTPAQPVQARLTPVSWQVSPGESLWTIAADVTAERLSRPATDAEIDPVWRAMIESNRHRLVDPGDPDRIFAGQVFEIPDSAGAEASTTPLSAARPG